MKVELDHFFILIDETAIGRVADLLLSLGMEESFSRDHAGQGTSNRRFPVSNSMLELLWLRDSAEAQSGPGRNLKFNERVSDNNASPFGLIFTRTEGASTAMPFDGWRYQPKYFDPPNAFHVGSNSNNIQEPLCVYVPFVAPQKRVIENGLFRSVSSVRVFMPSDAMSETLHALTKSVVQGSNGIHFEFGEEHLMEVTFDQGAAGLNRDLRPDLPLILHW